MQELHAGLQEHIEVYVCDERINVIIIAETHPKESHHTTEQLLMEVLCFIPGTVILYKLHIS